MKLNGLEELLFEYDSQNHNVPVISCDSVLICRLTCANKPYTLYLVLALLNFVAVDLCP